MKKLITFLLIITSLSLQAQNFFTKEVSLKVDTLTLKGTLTIPNAGTHVPVAIIIAGSGPTDRNGNNMQMQNNCLKMLSDSLAAHGIASLRYDKRVFAVMNNPNFREDSLLFDDFVKDAIAWIEYLKKDYDFTQYVLIGHSQGSLVAILAAEKIPVDKLVSLEGPGYPIGITLKKQFQAQPKSIQKYAIPIIDSLDHGKRVNNVPRVLYSVFRPSVQPFLISWMKYDPAAEISKLNIPVLIVQGENDIQVGIEDAKRLDSAANNDRLVIIPKMNHILKNAPKERRANLKTYFDPTLPINGQLVKEIVKFIKQ